MNTRTSRYGRFGLVVLMVLILPMLFLLAFTRPAGATQKVVTDKGVTWTETNLGWQAVITLPSMAISSADTAVIALDLRNKAFWYLNPQSSTIAGVPALRTIYAMSVADSIAMEIWVGRTAAIAAAKIFKINAMANQNYHLALGTPKANDVTLYPYPFWYVYVTNKTASGAAKAPVLTLFFPRMLVTELDHQQF